MNSASSDYPPTNNPFAGNARHRPNTGPGPGRRSIHRHLGLVNFSALMGGSTRLRYDPIATGSVDARGATIESHKPNHRRSAILLRNTAAALPQRRPRGGSYYTPTASCGP